MDTVHKNPEQENTDTEATQPADRPEAPLEPQQTEKEKTIAEWKRSAEQFENGPAMTLLRQKIMALPRVAKMAAVLLNDCYYAECQACCHNSINELLRDLHSEILDTEPSDTQEKELMVLYRNLQLIKEDGDTGRWRGSVEAWYS